MTGYGLVKGFTGGVLSPALTFFSFPPRWDRLWRSPGLQSHKHKGSSGERGWGGLGRVIDHSLSSVVEGENALICTSTPHYIVMLCCLIKLTSNFSFAGFPQLPSGFDPMSSRGVVVDRVAVRHIFSEYFSLPCQASLRLLDIDLSSWAGWVGPVMAGVRSVLGLTISHPIPRIKKNLFFSFPYSHLRTVHVREPPVQNWIESMFPRGGGQSFTTK
jgi:hypothetical protein